MEERRPAVAATAEDEGFGGFPPLKPAELEREVVGWLVGSFESVESLKGQKIQSQTKQFFFFLNVDFKTKKKKGFIYLFICLRIILYSFFLNGSNKNKKNEILLFYLIQNRKLSCSIYYFYFLFLGLKY